ncbi:hypothetical protein H0E84_08155 [Luteimonas sp. SJ-92]|uniref:Teneurin-like YD-shell domain-containing protein n=1 Tax=Luteimonas salinisoli TaxID=2752307 RepID=A0A853JAU5_9GAMM|nr:RHS repeat-associated core domain-containing protein [Luteimonas salinisoli]NZA26356.1 hypothetical protein [Luteimonas salinisoli]
MKGLQLWALCLLCWLAQASHAAETVRYIHTDALGSVVAVTDANGAVIERREYEPYGAQLTPAVADGPGYTGHVQDAATELIYMQQRYYDAGIGAFLSVDPVTALSSPVGQFHRYRYANSNPYRFYDPDGRCTGSRITNDDGTCRSTGGATTQSAPMRSIPSKAYAFDGAGGANSGDNAAFRNETSRRYSAKQYDSSAWGDNSQVSAAVSDASSFISDHKNGRIYSIGYSAGGHDAITFVNLLSAKGIRVQGLVLFDAHNKYVPGIFNFGVGYNVGVVLNFYQQNKWEIRFNTFRGGLVFGESTFNVNMGVDADVGHSNIVQKAFLSYGDQIDAVMGR